MRFFASVGVLSILLLAVTPVLSQGAPHCGNWSDLGDQINDLAEDMENQGICRMEPGNDYEPRPDLSIPTFEDMCNDLGTIMVDWSNLGEEMGCISFH